MHFARIKKSAGKQYNPLLSFFDLNKPYVYYKEKGDWISLYESFVQDKIVFTPVMKRIFLTSGQETEQEKREFVMALFSIAAIFPDTGLSFNMKGILNDKEWYGYWQTQNEEVGYIAFLHFSLLPMRNPVFPYQKEKHPYY